MMRTLLRLWLLLAAGLVSSAPHALTAPADDELLDPEQAFALAVTALEGGRLEAHWRIADGYYLYRSKLRLTSTTGGITLGDLTLPAGQVKQDEFFGKVEIYRGDLKGQAPVTRADTAPARLTLTADYQGCADIGVCYPPQRKEITLDLPAAATTAAVTPAASPAAADANPLAALGRKLGFSSGEEEVLDPEVAFVLSAEPQGPDAARLQVEIAPGHYLYRHKFKFTLPQGSGVRLGEFALPAGEEKEDEFFGRIQVFHNHLEAKLPLLRESPEAREVTLEVAYQGCAEAGICYPPMTRQFPLKLPAATTLAPAMATSTTAAVASAQPLPAAAAAAPPKVAEQDRLANLLMEGNLAVALLAFFAAGLLLAFTPCVFPMIPILSSIIVGQGQRLSTARAFTLSLVYVLAMAGAYTVAGVIAGLFGANIQAAFQNPWVLGSFAAVFVALAFSMFGFYELQLPSALQSRITEVSNQQQGGTLTGVAVMGLLSALIVGPCVAPPLMGALIVIGKTGDPWLGGAALFALSLGMGAPLLAIGTSAGQLLPRAGAWMDAVKAVFGVLMLAVAIWMLERILPAALTLLLWALLFIVSAVYMGALESSAGSSGWRRAWKGLGLVLLAYGGLMLVGVASGGRDPLAPLAHLRLAGGAGDPALTQTLHVNFKRIKSSGDLDRELAAARAAGKPLFLDFYADWCVSCKEFEKYTFGDPAVVKALAGAVSLQADVTANDAEDQALLKRFKLIGPPALLFFGADGGERQEYRLVGFESAPEFRGRVEAALR